MSSTSSRFNVENFDPPPDEELVCSICHCIFDEPVECPCRHVFCRGCITSWLKQKSSCPICRKRVFVRDIQQVVPLIRNIIAKLTLFCSNRENGCKLKTKLENYTQHVSECQYERILCKNKNCTSAVMRKDIQKHKKVDCKFRRMLCKKGCNLIMPSFKIKHHNCLKKLKKEMMKELKKQLDESTKRSDDLLRNLLSRLSYMVESSSALMQKDIQKCQVDYKFGTIRCKKGCNLMLPSSNNEHHNCIKELMKELKKELKDQLNETTERSDVLLRNLLSRLFYMVDTWKDPLVNTSESLGTGNDQTAPQQNAASSSASNVRTESSSPQQTNSRVLKRDRRYFGCSSHTEPRANGPGRPRELLELSTVEDMDWEQS